MIKPSQLIHLLHINRILVKHGLDEVIFAAHLLRPLRFMFYIAPWNWFRSKRAPRGQRIRLALEELGPIFVKFGQILSTRRDLLPDDIAIELSRLQDKVPPFSGQQAIQTIERAYGKPLQEVFQTFDEIPLASASIAQVHTATLHDGKEVVVKVLRPKIEEVIRRDLSLLYYIAGLAEKYWADGRRLRPLEVVDEFEKIIFDELDLVREAANATQIRRNFEISQMLYVPEIYWPYARREVIVMERIYGTPISDIEKLRALGIDMKALAEQGVEIFYTQVFSDNFFHADMHPGNIFVSDEGQYIAVDFGIIGTLTANDQRYLAENMLAFFNRDYRRVAELHVQSGWVPSATRVDEFESAIRAVCEPNFNRPLKEISFGQVLLRLFQTARRFNMEVQPQLVLLQKTLLNIEGLGRQLYPDLDLWSTAKPFMERWMNEQIGSTAFLKRLRDNLPAWSEKMPELPTLTYDFMNKAVNGQLQINYRSDELEKIRKDMNQNNNRIVAAVGASTLAISAVLISVLKTNVSQQWLGVPAMSWVLGALAVYLFFVAWLKDQD
jgi:ubiquinone biosynthesis protein